MLHETARAFIYCRWLPFDKAQDPDADLMLHLFFNGAEISTKSVRIYMMMLQSNETLSQKSPKMAEWRFLLILSKSLYYETIVLYYSLEAQGKSHEWYPGPVLRIAPGDASQTTYSTAAVARAVW